MTSASQLTPQTLIAIGGGVGALLALLAVLTVWLFRRAARDEIFLGLTPGLLPGIGQPAEVGRTSGKEWSGTVAPAFAPPQGVSPGTLATLLDGRAEARAISATILDLAARGWFRIEPMQASPDGGVMPGVQPGQKPKDYLLTRAEVPPQSPLTDIERELLSRIFGADPAHSVNAVRLSGLKQSFPVTSRQVRDGLYREVVERGWYREHPRAKRRWPRVLSLLVGLPLTVGLAGWAGLMQKDGYKLLGGIAQRDLAPAVAAAAAGAALATVILFLWGTATMPRTAAGTAARIEGLGFKEYLGTAEAHQIRLEEAAHLFSRYLPYAIAFGVTAHWTRLFQDLARTHEGLADAIADSLSWFDIPFDPMLFEGIGAIADLSSGFVDSVGGVLDTGGGCSGCTPVDGCDALDGCDGIDGCDGCDGCSW